MQVDHHLHGEMIGNESPTRPPETFAERFVGSEAIKAISGGQDVAGTDDETGFVVLADFVGAVEVVSDYRFACGKRLRESARNGFPVGEVHQTIHDAEVLRNFRRLDQAGIGDFIGNAEIARARFDLGAERAIADEQKASLRPAGQE